jgi:hypothetical protein
MVLPESETFNRPPPSQDDAEQPSSISPIACVFDPGRQLLFEATMDMADFAASHACSAAECAWRGDTECLGAHLEQAQSALKAALMTFRELEAELGKAAP